MAKGIKGKSVLTGTPEGRNVVGTAKKQIRELESGARKARREGKKTFTYKGETYDATSPSSFTYEGETYGKYSPSAKKASGGRIKSYTRGGSVRGAGIATKGSRPCKMR